MEKESARRDGGRSGERALKVVEGKMYAMIYLAKGDVALSVTISSVSTLVGVIATPLLTRFYVDAHIQVDVMGMLLSILQIVVIPIGLGLIVHYLFPRVVKAVEPWLPAFSMVCIPSIR